MTHPAENGALAERLTTIAAKLIRASYDADVERMAAALGNASLAVKAEADSLRARPIPPGWNPTPPEGGYTKEDF